jgi:glycosyltransferase involved in cell wall biosynthesis
MRELRQRGWQISLFSLVPADEPPGLKEALAEGADRWELFPRSPRRVRRALSLGVGLLRQRAFQQDWFWSRDAAAACRAWLQASPGGVLFVEQLYMYPYVPLELRRSSALDTQNVEVFRLQAMARSGSSRLRRLMARLQLSPVARFEARAVASVGRVLAVSREEQKAFEKIAPGRVHLVPNGVHLDATPLARPPDSRRLLYVGSMGYGPNADAVTHFLEDIVPLVLATKVSFDVVGSKPPSSVRRAASRAVIETTVHGFVPNVDSHYAGKRAMVVPLRHGGGTRLKILEALARGLPVITTSVGCAGLGVTNGREALVADTERDFAAAIDRLLIDDDLWMDLSRTGRAHVERYFGWKSIGQTLHTIMRELESGN